MVVALASQNCRLENNDSGYVPSHVEETVLHGSPPESRSKSPKSDNEIDRNKVRLYTSSHYFVRRI